MIKIKRALISVSDKKNVVELAKLLASADVEILSTGGTAKLLRENKIPVVEVAEYTNFPEMLGGRVKTLHPRIHGGILGVREDKEHIKTMQENDIPPIDLVVVNLYPFEKTIQNPDCTLEEAIDHQMASGRLYAKITSRPGQSGRCDGAILEGAELSFYQKQMNKK